MDIKVYNEDLSIPLFLSIPCTDRNIIKNAEPCVVYFPKPAIDKVKIQGHIIEQNNPPLKKA